MKEDKIIHNGRLLAIVFFNSSVEEGIHFFTSDSNALQVGQHFYPSGKIIQPHKHVPVKVEYHQSLQEVLYIEEGKVKIDFYSLGGQKIDEKILTKGDIALLMEGGHGFEFLEETKMVEIKQGPYIPESKKALEVKE